MEGYGNVDLGGNPNTESRAPNVIAGLGSLRAMVNQFPAKYGYLVDATKLITYPSYTGTKTYPSWKSRDDVWVSYWDDDQSASGLTVERRNGALDVGFGVQNNLPEGSIGPEYAFGQLLGNKLDEKVLLIKTAWGGKSLAVDFRPPSSVLANGGVVGPYYLEMIDKVHRVLADIKTYYPDYDGAGYELAGFGWHQGWNDRGVSAYVNEYEANMVNLIRDVRKEFNVPALPVVIANTGMADVDEDPLAFALITAQAYVADPKTHPEFAGTVSTIDTRDFYDPSNSPTSGFIYHWNLNGQSYFHIGESMGIEMLHLMGLSDESTASTIPTIRPPKSPLEGYIFCGREGEVCSLPALSNVAYGADGKFNYLYNQIGQVTLNNVTFEPDPAPGVPKAGFYQLVNASAAPTGSPTATPTKTPTATPTPTQSSPLEGYTFCARQYQVCSLPGLSTVAYGADGKYIYIYNQRGDINIGDDTFGGDPALNVWKAAYYQLVDQQADASKVASALSKLTAHLAGNLVLTANEINQQALIIRQSATGVGYNDTLINQAWSLVNSYEKSQGPLFMNAASKGGFINDFSANDGYEWIRAIFTVQQALHDYAFTADNLSKYESLLKGKKFLTTRFFPGDSPLPSDANARYTVKINATLAKEWGNPTAFGSTPARRPTGYYLSAGSLGTVTVPPALVNKGFEILVGAHNRDRTPNNPMRRFFQVSKSFPITSTVTKIINPFGGGIYIVTPYQANAGVVDVTLTNVVPAPFFSATAHHQTTLQEWLNVQRHNPAPWADFESDKFMMQVPSSWIYNYADPVTLMQDWDKRMDVVSDFLGYPRLRNNTILYLQVDTDIMLNGYGIGYPQINNTYDPDAIEDGNKDHWLLKPGANFFYDEFHEFGHAQLFSKFPGHEEADVNVLTAAILNNLYQVDIDEALVKSSYTNLMPNFTRDQAAINWMVTPNFRAGQPMDITDTTKNEVRYQQRGYAYIVEIADLFGWKVWQDFYYQEQIDYMANKPSDGLSEIDSRILRLSKKAGVDLRPLIHFWGVQPDNDAVLSSALSAAGLEPSQKIYDRLLHYKSLIPMNNTEFRAHANMVLPGGIGLGEDPNYGEGWYYIWLPLYNSTHGVAAQSAMQKTIIDRYFPGGRPQ